LDITAWLRGLGLERFAQAFLDAEVTPEALPELTDADLRELGLPLGPRRLVLRAIRDLPGAPTPRVVATRGTLPVPPEAERRRLTVAFCDLVGSTALSRRLDPEEMREVLRTYQNAVTGEIARLEGHVAKLMGDGVLAYFGWPRTHENEAERAVRAGLACTEAVARLTGPGAETLAARVGIATGLVVVGDLAGEGAAQEEAVTGETPNLAARLQELAEPSQVVVADGTRQLLGALFALEDLGPRTLKGFAEPVHAWRVAGPGMVEGRFGALRGAGLGPLVGRERELRFLLDAWAEVAGGEGRIALIAGEPGIGKSRLIEALKARLVGSLRAGLEYQGSPLHAQSALHPFATELERAAQLRRDDPPPERCRKLDALLAERLGHEAVAIFGPPLAGLLGLPTGGRLSLDLTPQQLKAKMLAALVAQVEGMASRGPLLLVFEDAHWADPSSLELLSTLAKRAASLPVLMLVSHRPEFEPGWRDLPHVTPVMLERLNRQEATMLAKQIAGEGRLRPAIVERIVARADGVPLFIEELARDLAEEQSSEHGPDARPLRAEEVPSALHDLLCARLDRLGPAKEVLQVGSAIGREFSHILVTAASRLEPHLLDEALHRATESRLLVCEGAGRTATYRFRHALVQEAAYGSMLRSRRRELHARIARVVEEHAPDFRNAEPEWLARHYAEAGDAGRAAALWLKAGLRAKATFATREATAHLTNCLEAAHAGDERAAGSDCGLRRVRAEALIALGDLASLAEDLAAADRHYQAAIDAAPDPDLRRRIENKRHHPKTATRSGAGITFHEHGSGDTTLLFVSTQAVGLATFRPILERLCDEFRIVTVDPRGSGGSAPLIRPYLLSEHAADVRAVIAALGAPKLVGVGISMGANLLFRIAHVAPGLLAGIVTVGAPVAGHQPPFFPDDWLRLQQETRRTLEVEPMLRLHVRHVFSEPEMREMLETIVRTRLGLPHETLLSFFLDDQEDDVVPLLPTIATPTLITHGRDDRLVSFAAAELMVSSLPNARLHGFEGKGHLPLFTATQEFCEVVRAFVKDVVPAARAALQTEPRTQSHQP
jgi:class 3 adenylate cyclase/pimeloyl-ACP methyl ester carboxylesterase